MRVEPGDILKIAKSEFENRIGMLALVTRVVNYSDHSIPTVVCVNAYGDRSGFGFNCKYGEFDIVGHQVWQLFNDNNELIRKSKTFGSLQHSMSVGVLYGVMRQPDKMREGIQ